MSNIQVNWWLYSSNLTVGNKFDCLNYFEELSELAEYIINKEYKLFSYDFWDNKLIAYDKEDTKMIEIYLRDNSDLVYLLQIMDSVKLLKESK